MNKILKKISLLLLACMVLSGCQNKASDGSTVYKTPVSNTSFMFDTVTTITLYSAKTEKDPEEIILDTFKMCKDLENKLSKTIETSDVSLINNSQGEPITVSSETAELINLSKKYYELSNGAFDITIAPLSEKWNFLEKAATLGFFSCFSGQNEENPPPFRSGFSKNFSRPAKAFPPLRPGRWKGQHRSRCTPAGTGPPESSPALPPGPEPSAGSGRRRHRQSLER